MLQNVGAIKNLQCQVKYNLIPTQVLPHPFKKGKHYVRKERGVTYIADFVYERDGEYIVEDVKSKATQTPQYKIKRKLMLWKYKIQVVEV